MDPSLPLTAFDPAPPLTPAPVHKLPEKVAACLSGGREFFYSLQRPEGHWCGELQSNPTIVAEYVFLRQILGLDLNERAPGIIRYLDRLQNPDGSWGIAEPADGGDVSTTAEAYLALRILGLERGHPMLARAERYILRNGGLEGMRIFTRINLAMFGLVPWQAVPAIPPEFILLPPRSPVNIYNLASWARGTMVPLFVIFHHRPVYALPNGLSPRNDWLDHLWLNPQDKNIPYAPELRQLLKRNGLGWESFFGAADFLLKRYEGFRQGLRSGGLRQKALRRCVKYVLDHQEKSGDWGGIFPPMFNGVLALMLEGHSLDSEAVRRGLRSIEDFSWEDEAGFRLQACVSPVWDTALGLIAMLDGSAACGSGAGPDPRLRKAADWLVRHQITEDRGDWKVYRPALGAGGWSFEYHNTWYPDVDDTAAVLLSLLKTALAQTGPCPPPLVESLARGLAWTLGMQNHDGGWAAFDVDNDKLFLNKIPFSDMESLCDTSCPDITGRVLEACGQFLKLRARLPAAVFDPLARDIRAAGEAAIAYLRRTQERAGSWFGRWGVNYVYGTSNVLCGLAQIGVAARDPLVQRALTWLESVQNKDEGWGESVDSYENKCKMGVGASTASQTAWAVMGLLSYLPADRLSVVRGVEWLVRHQVPATAEDVFEGGRALPRARGRTWKEAAFTGTGFPGHFYLRYHLYRHYFPMMALGRFLARAPGAGQPGNEQ